MIQYIQLNFTRIDFDRDFSVGVKTEIAAQQGHQAADLRFIQIGWRTAAPVQLADVTASKKRRAMHNFLFKRIKILVGFVLLTGNDFIAAAEVAELVAERNMDVERQRTLRIARDSLLEISLAEGIGELQRGGV